MLVNRPCELGDFLRNDRLVRHNCDATLGAAGSAILMQQDGHYQISALLVGLDRQGIGIAVTGKVFNGASDSTIPEEAPSGDTA